MKKIKNLGRIKNKNGNWFSAALYLCPFCFKEVIKSMPTGERDKSCGCARYELSSKSQIGKKRTEEQNKRNSERRKDEYAKGKVVWNKGKHATEETKQRMRENHADFSGENHPNWNGGSSFELYGIEFNKKLKNFIKIRDSYICQNPNCKKGYYIVIDIHHINYNKKDNRIINLISLCKSCHVQTNNRTKRYYWTNYYTDVVSIYL